MREVGYQFLCGHQQSFTKTAADPPFFHKLSRWQNVRDPDPVLPPEMNRGPEMITTLKKMEILELKK
jgi:hypothetical protein